MSRAAASLRPAPKAALEKGYCTAVVASSRSLTGDSSRERAMVSVALLLADDVVLLSPVTAALLEARKFDMCTPERQIDVLRAIAPSCVAPSDTAAVVRGLSAARRALHTKGAVSAFDAASRASRELVMKRLAPAAAAVKGVADGLLRDADLDPLAELEAIGLLHPDMGSSDGDPRLLAAGFRTALAAESADDRATTPAARLIAAFEAGLRWYLFSRGCAVLVDAGSMPLGLGHGGPAVPLGRLPVPRDFSVPETVRLRSTLEEPMRDVRVALLDLCDAGCTTRGGASESVTSPDAEALRTALADAAKALGSAMKPAESGGAETGGPALELALRPCDLSRGSGRRRRERPLLVARLED